MADGMTRIAYRVVSDLRYAMSLSPPALGDRPSAFCRRGEDVRHSGWRTISRPALAHRPVVARFRRMPPHTSSRLPAHLHTVWDGAALRGARARLAARDEETLRTQIAVSEIAAPTGEEARRAEWMARRFRALGLAGVRVDGAGNVIGRRPGAAAVAPVVVCAHLDTVFPRGVAVTVRRDGTRLVGPGIGDNGRGLAGMLALAEVIDGRLLRTRAPVDFVATTGEEGAGDLRGAKHLFANGGRGVAAAVILDGAGDERIVYRALGSRRFRITYRGAGGHSWTAFGTPNAVHAAAIAAARLAMLPLPPQPRTTLSVGRIGGGLSINAIPHEGWLEVDLRSSSPAVLERLEREIRAAARHAESEENARRALGTSPLAVDVAVIGDRPTGETAPDHPLVATTAAATRLIGRDPELATASTDANVPISLGIPAIAIGAGGRGGDAHTEGEWFENTDGALGLARALGVVVGVAGLAD
jgi:acetylornithine deacetylase/succinyl-diaminopimelate desuccinylase-like protein